MKLLTVEAIFPMRELGLIVCPGPPFDSFGTKGNTHSCSVIIKRPDASIIAADAKFFLAHFNPLEAQLRYLENGCYVCVLENVDKLDVPIGSEMHTNEA